MNVVCPRVGVTTVVKRITNPTHQLIKEVVRMQIILPVLTLLASHTDYKYNEKVSFDICETYNLGYTVISTYFN